VLLPPIVVVPFMPVAAHSVRVTAAIVVSCFPTPSVVIGCFAIPRIVVGWFPIPRIVSGPFITPRIVCCCGLRRLTLWLRKNPVRARLGFRCLLRSRGLTGRRLLSVWRWHRGHDHPNQWKKSLSHNSLDRNKQASLSKMRDFVRLGGIDSVYRRTSLLSSTFDVGGWAFGVFWRAIDHFPYSSSFTFSIQSTGCVTTRSGWKLALDEPTSAYRHNRSGELRKLSRASGQCRRPSQAPDQGVAKVVVTITKGKLDLGPWEHVFYGEFDGRRKKRALVKIMGD
jgi:hypothetical protein